MRIARRVCCRIASRFLASDRSGGLPLRAAPMVVMALGCAQPPPTSTPETPDVEWAHYGGDPGGNKYSPLADINRENVADLEVAWVVRAADFAAEIFDSNGHRAGTRREDGQFVKGRVGAPCGSCHTTQIRFESTPLMRDRTLYVSTPRNRVLALDPATGATHWTFDARIDVRRRYVEDFVSRGLSAWFDGTALPESRCARRIFLATIDARLFALDAADGRPCSSFGERGVVRLSAGLGVNDRDVVPSRYTITSPPAVMRDVIIVGSAIDNNRRNAASGVVRAYDARTGNLRWSFNPIPRTEGHPAGEVWTPETARTTGGANVWSIISTDAERDLVFLPTSSAGPDFYGGERVGRNTFANSVVAVRGSTGEVVWSFQVVHHDIWDYDVPAQPVLITLRRHGREIPAVAVGTKTGMIFVLDRATGAPLLPVEERAVPRSDVPGETAWPTQPFPVKASVLHGTLLTPDSAFGINDTDRVFCRNWIARLRNEGIFTPPSLRGSIVWPGVWGGINWDGMAWDPDRQLIVTTVKRLAMVVQLHPRGAFDATLRNKQADLLYMPQEGTPYGATRALLVAPSGMPCTPPPWGSLVAVDLADAAIRWKRPLGRVPWLGDVPGSEEWGSIVFGGPLVTNGGLVFIGASQDDRFRAFDVETGVLLWDHALPAGGQAAPMTYRYNGRQYVVITAGGRSGIGSPGDWIVAFALPERMPRPSRTHRH